MTTFDELNISKPLMNALNDLGYIYMTPIQQQAFPVVMSGKNVIGLAQTGTGKTLAYLLPLLRKLTYSEQRQPRILILVPTRELVLQVLGEIELLTKYMQVRYGGVYGGSNMSSQKTLVNNGLDILVATPGRLMDLCLNGWLRLKSIQHLVIDEVDEMLSLGFRTQIIQTLDLLPQRRQNLLFSATMSPDVEKLIFDYVLDPKKIEITPMGVPVEKISQMAYAVPNFHTRANLLEYLLKASDTLSKVLVFVKSRKAADDLYLELSARLPNQLGVIHSNRSQPQRFKAIEKFEAGTHRVLIATDIIARGLDITGVSHVINFDTPDVPADYTHRIGRTGRAESLGGAAMTFVGPAEKEKFEGIEAFVQKKIPLEKLPVDLKISTVLTEEEKPSIKGKNATRSAVLKDTQGAFHEKKDKNKKVNLGGPGVRYAKKGSVRSAKKKRKY
jgi:ATP-dependent RNA helicase RhlE